MYMYLQSNCNVYSVLIGLVKKENAEIDTVDLKFLGQNAKTETGGAVCIPQLQTNIHE